MSISSITATFGSLDQFHLPWNVFYRAVITVTIKAYQNMYNGVIAKRAWEEDTFTLLLKDHIQKQVDKEFLPIQVDAHVKVHTTEMRTGEVSVKEASEIDLKLFRPLDSSSDYFYFAWECKLIGEKNKDLVWRYVTNGILRFINGDYSEQCSASGMIGYVQDSDPVILTNKLNSSMIARKNPPRLTSADHLSKTDPIEGFTEIYLSEHNRLKGVGDITLHHLFFTFIWETAPSPIN